MSDDAGITYVRENGMPMMRVKFLDGEVVMLPLGARMLALCAQPSPIRKIVERVASAACDAILDPSADHQRTADACLSLFREFGPDDPQPIRKAFAGYLSIRNDQRGGTPGHRCEVSGAEYRRRRAQGGERDFLIGSAELSTSKFRKQLLRRRAIHSADCEMREPPERELRPAIRVS